MELPKTASQVTEVLGDRYPCARCGSHTCTKGKPLCDSCDGKCLVCQKTPAAELCAPCAAAAKVRFQEFKVQRRCAPHWSEVLAFGSDDCTLKTARQVLKCSSISERVIRAGDNGSTGSRVVKHAAVAAAAWLAEMPPARRSTVSAALRITSGASSARTRHFFSGTKKVATLSSSAISTTEALTAADAIGASRRMVPALADTPLQALAIASEVVQERLNRGDLNSEMHAKVANVVPYVHRAITTKARRQLRNSTSNYETLETFAREQAERAVARVLGNRTLPQNSAARHAAATPKERKHRESCAASHAKIKAPKLDGSYKPVCTGDQPSLANHLSKSNKKNRRRAKAYRKVQRLGLEHKSVKKYEKKLYAEYLEIRRRKLEK